jgi:hypothetical protein
MIEVAPSKPPSTPRLLRLYRLVRRKGVPHEETVAYPAVGMLLCVTLSWGINFPIWLSAYISAIFMCLCGAWLGFAWSKPRYGALAIRTVLISLLIVGGVVLETLFCCSWVAVKAHDDYGHLLAITVLAVAMSWGNGFVIGSTLRDMTIMLFISEEQRAIFEQRWPYRLWTEFLRDFLRNPVKKIAYWARLGVDREDEEKATTFDLHMAHFIKYHGIKLVLAIIGTAIGAPIAIFKILRL